MPFQDGVYYPYSSDTQGNHSSAGIPSLLNSPLSQRSVKVQSLLGMAPSGAPPAIMPFRFRQRRESVDWRRIHAVDIDQVISQLEVDVLQEHISTVTFCSLDGERCQRCQSPVDRALIKILQLAQLTVEWLLHCQECLTVNLQAAEERLASANMQHEQLLAQLKKQDDSMMAMTAELKNRRKIIRKQQSLFAPHITNSQKCAFCNKKFLTTSFLQSHMQRRHPDENDMQLQSNSEEKSQIHYLKSEMNSLKEQIIQQQQTLEAKTAENQKLQRHIEESELQIRESEKKSQIESLKQEIKNLKDLIQHQHIIQTRTAEDERQQSKDKDVLKELDHFKAVEMVHIQAIQKLEQQQKQQDKKWESRLGKITSIHEAEKNDLQKELNRLQSTVMERQEQSKRQLQEMRRKLQEKEQTIRDQREQILTASSNPATKILKVPASAPAPEPKPKKVILDLTSIQEKKPVEKKPQTFTEKKNKVSTRKSPNKTEIKQQIEQDVMTKLESLGMKPEQNKLKSKDLRSILTNLRTKQQSLGKQLPDYWRHRVDIINTLERKLALKWKDSHQSPNKSRHAFQVFQTRPRASSLPSRVIKGVSEVVARQAKTPQPAPRVRTTIQPNTSTPNYKAAQRELAHKTPPFSSFVDSDTEEDELLHHQWGRPSQARVLREDAIETNARKPNLIQARPVPTGLSPSISQLAVGVTKTAIMELGNVDDDEEDDGDDDDDDDYADDFSDVSELQEIVPGQLQSFKDQNGNVKKTSFATENKVSDLARKIEEQVLNKSTKKPVGGVSILPELKDEVQEFSSSDLDESSEYAFDDKKDKKPPHNSGTMMKSQDSVSTSVWESSTGKDTSLGKAPKSGLQAGLNGPSQFGATRMSRNSDGTK
ncbi:cilium assembly protein DZIP1 isoform X2 [Corythoichthys intestinalis]|uniref:cilium assembly protein DZIP1 isoform X2 n=1 Tax=Corythoichthys intestinalis TaxID=161448 RepID=UPI0025A52E7F|nr:cilium assembly protein DZIP1 isoform X2 [Corythoichthys intestinalis]